MTDERSSDLLSALPRSRPHRRSAKRPARQASAPETGAERTPATTSQVARKKDAATKSSHRAAPSTRSSAKAAKAVKAAKAAKGAAKPATGAAKPAARTTTKPAARTPAKPAARTRATAPAARGVTSAGARPAGPSRQGKPLAQPAQPRGVPRGNRGQRPEPSTEFPVLRTAVQAAAELTEIGVTLSAKALRGALGRLPRP